MDRHAHADQSSQGTNGNVNASGDHYDTHTAGEDNKGRILIENIEESLGLQEAGAEKHDSADVHQEEYHNGDRQQKRGIRHRGVGLEAAVLIKCLDRRHLRPPPSPHFRGSSSFETAFPARPGS